MNPVRLASLASPLCAILFSGCGSLFYEEDPEKIKLAQQASLATTPGSNKVAGQSIRSYFSGRSVMIMPASNVNDHGGFSLGRTGWAAALTPDGYYLTVAHAAAKEPPVCFGGRLGMTFLKGRIVQVFPDRDLAILKFPRKPRKHYSVLGAIPKEGELVYTAGTYGPDVFQAKGTASRVEGYSKEAKAWGISTTIPGMSGMSGAPVTNGRGDLLGVIRGGSYSRLSGKAFATELSMLRPSLIEEAIQNDRRRRRQD